MDLATDGQATIVGPDGSVAQKPTVPLSVEDATILRAYETFLKRSGLRREAIHCQNCYEWNLMDGTRFNVTAEVIWIECRCKVRVFQGPTI